MSACQNAESNWSIKKYSYCKILITDTKISADERQDNRVEQTVLLLQPKQMFFLVNRCRSGSQLLDGNILG